MTSSRTLARPTITPTLTSATAIAAARTAVVQPQRIAARHRRPVAPAQHQDVHIKEEDRDGIEVENRRQADDPLGEVVEVVEDAERAGRAFERRDRRADRVAGHHQRRAEQRAGDERHRRVAGQERREHSHRDQRRARKPVAGVVAQHQPEVRGPQVEEDEDIAE